ncbi:MAG TPA: PLP-dependent aminotransferase family protein [Actinomycetota bacterium]|jgi:DNA-binding transcriptional MocR family regulator
MSELTNDPYVDLYADRMTGMTASEVRALFAVASRPDVVSLAGGMPFVAALPGGDVMDVVDSVLRDHGSAALQYCGGIGLPGVRERLVALMAEEGVGATADRVVVTNGAQQALDLIGKIFVDPGDEIAVEEPSYVGAISAFSAYEPRFLQFPLDEDGLVVSALEDALAAGARPKFVYTIPNFSNPAGVTMSLARRERLVEVCRRFGVPIVEDNPYGMLRFEGQPVPSLRSLDPGNVIYLGTLSKVFAPGIRVGWALAEHGTLDRLVLAKEAADLCSSAFTQLVAERYLDGDRWRTNLRTLVDVYRSRRDAMLDALRSEFPADAHWTVPHGGFYVWATTPGVDTPTLLPEAVERKVAYVPGTAFYPDGRGRDRMRLSFCYPPEESIREGIRRLGHLLADHANLRPAATA